MCFSQKKKQRKLLTQRLIREFSILKIRLKELKAISLSNVLKKKEKYEYRPCKRCGENHYIYNRMKWLCKECDAETTKERRGDLQSLFMEIWEERPHICVKCGKHLGDEPKAIFFSHIRSRGARPDLKMDKNNIELLCSACHRLYEFNEREIV